MQPLKKLSDTYSIDTLKGFFPHHFNTPENQNYIGKIPDEEFYGPSNMSEKDYKEFKQWYDQQSSVSDWNFQNELKRYCEADVELLGKTVLKFRKMFKAKPIDVDPFRYVTLASLCVSIYLNLFIPEKTIVGNGSDKKDSRVCREWLNHLQNPDLRPEVPIILDIDELNITDEERNNGKINCTKSFYQKPKVSFTVDALDRKRKHVKEFLGCYWHGCQKCHPENTIKYNKTVERRNILIKAGYNVQEIWECEWNKQQETKTNKAELEEKAKEQTINIR